MYSVLAEVGLAAAFPAERVGGELAVARRAQVVLPRPAGRGCGLRAVEFLARNTALPLHEVRTEVDRYISWPGQALAYKLGEMKIRELRRRAEANLGARFDVREFHDVVLRNGSVTLGVLESLVTEWIEDRAAEGTAAR